jgi:hypothetical protein
MPCIVKGVKPHHIRVEQCMKNVAPYGYGTKDLRGREGGVEEEPKFGAWKSPSEKGWQCDQVVIMHPNEILFWVENLGDSVSEKFVGREVGAVESRVKGQAAMRGRGEGEEVV